MATRRRCTIVLLLLFGASADVVSHTSGSACPQQCSCRQLAVAGGPTQARLVNCASRKLVSVPTTLPNDTEILRLQRNAIASVRDTQSHLWRLRQLDLSYNAIRQLGGHALYRQSKVLQRVNLDHNQLRYISADDFANLTELLELTLSNNQIAQIADDAFSGLGKVESLSLSGNQLERLDSTWFADMSSLRTLALNDNDIGLIADATFESLKRLNRLSLANNRLRVARKYTFRGMTKLQYLDLDRNRFTSVPAESFATLSSLSTLSLNGNPISTIAPRDFDSLPVVELRLGNMADLEVVDERSFAHLLSLRTLLMRNNTKLAYVEDGAFLDLPALCTLDIRNCSLASLPADLSRSLPMLSDLSVARNPIRCDCNLQWLAGFDARVLQRDTVKCDSPPHLVGVDIQKVNHIDHVPKIIE